LIAEGKKIEECVNWLLERQTAPLTDFFFYKESDGEIKAVAGKIHGIGRVDDDSSFFLQIEPMISESKRASYELYNEIMEYAKKINTRFIYTGSNNIKVHKNLEKLGWRKWNDQVTHYIKELR